MSIIKLRELLDEDLRRWVKEKWVDQHGRPCGSAKTKGIKKCRPSKKVSKDTPKTWKAFDKKENCYSTMIQFHQVHQHKEPRSQQHWVQPS